MTIKVGLGGGLAALGVDTTWPSNGAAGGSLTVLSGVDVQGSLQDVINASGKFAFQYLYVSALTAEVITVKLTIDGVVVWNDVDFSGPTGLFLYNSDSAAKVADEGGKVVNSTFVFQMKTATDTSINVSYFLRPIL